MKKIDIKELMDKIQTIKDEHALREIAQVVDNYCAAQQLYQDRISVQASLEYVADWFKEHGNDAPIELDDRVRNVTSWKFYKVVKTGYNFAYLSITKRGEDYLTELARQKASNG